MENQTVSKSKRWAGYVISGLSSLFLFLSATGKFVQPEGMEQYLDPLGWRADQMIMLGIIQVTCVVLYLIPQAAVLGAVLVTGYLGGATATNLRIDDPFFFFPAIIGVFFWLGLYLREPRLWELLPFRKSQRARL